MLVGLLAAAACAFAPPIHAAHGSLRRCRGGAFMSDTDDISQTDPNFASDELSRVWARAGKGKKLWKPGDDTGDTVLDTRLLWTSWVLTPLLLHVGDGCSRSTAACLVLGWLGLPFTAMQESVGARPLPWLEGAGVPASNEGDEGLQTYEEICSFAVAATAGKQNVRTVAPPTGRPDLARWLEAPSVTSFAPLLRGRQVEDGTPCLNPWGLSMDDALALPVLKVLLEAPTPAGVENEENDALIEYVKGCYEKAQLPL